MFLRIYAQEGERIPVSFEAYADAIRDWAGMFLEMDGSFVWTVDAEKQRLQVDGMIYDRDGAIEYVELKGEWPPEAWHRLLRPLVGLMDPIAVDDVAPTLWEQLRVHDVAGQQWKTPNDILLELRQGSIVDGK
ncbi:MAG: hypothetical protein MUF23_04030 [Pirellula sp.]|jgi:hypothetical protein|nr:hypothetical protein [Pirellula sp.]